VPDNTEIAWSKVLPWRLEQGDSITFIDKVGPVTPDTRIIERWQNQDAPPENHRFIGKWENPTYDGQNDRINVDAVSIQLPQQHINDLARLREIREDAELQTIREFLLNSTKDELKDFVNTSVTDLASAKVLLRRIVLALALLARRVQ
jgi:hypothetical protein